MAVNGTAVAVWEAPFFAAVRGSQNSSPVSVDVVAGTGTKTVTVNLSSDPNRSSLVQITLTSADALTLAGLLSA